MNAVRRKILRLQAKQPSHRKPQGQGAQSGIEIPPWTDLISMKSDQIRALADSLGIEYTDAVKTRSAIHRSRQ